MNNLHRTTRIQVRCSEKERSNLLQMATELNLTLSTLMRDAVTIAYYRAHNPRTWQRHLNNAKDRTPEEFLWITS